MDDERDGMVGGITELYGGGGSESYGGGGSESYDGGYVINVRSWGGSTGRCGTLELPGEAELDAGNPCRDISSCCARGFRIGRGFCLVASTALRWALTRA